MAGGLMRVYNIYVPCYTLDQFRGHSDHSVLFSGSSANSTRLSRHDQHGLPPSSTFRGIFYVVAGRLVDSRQTGSWQWQ
jgi:hypothetical protein